MYYTDNVNFYEGHDPLELIKKFGSPLYVYSEKVLRTSIRNIKQLAGNDFSINYSAKANSNLAILQIVCEEGLDVDAMSPGEIEFELKAGFKPEQIFFICNNVSIEEMQYAVERGITVSVDSLSQLELFGSINRGGRVAVRINPGVGAGHHEKVVTGGDKTKFGVSDIDKIKQVCYLYDLKLIGLNQHIGSLFMEKDSYIQGVETMLKIAKGFEDLEFLDFGGGFGIPYRKQQNEVELALEPIRNDLLALTQRFTTEYGRQLKFKIEPGRYIVAECGVLLGTVHAMKQNGAMKFAGTDIGMNVLVRPSMYDAYHDVEIYNSEGASREVETVSIVGNICESGDIIVKSRSLPKICENDVIAIMDAGAYGHVMSSNYNMRLRPAELLIRENSDLRIIRNRDTIEDLFNKYIPL